MSVRRVRMLAASASLMCNGLGAAIFSAAATPACCGSTCNHAEASRPTVVMLRFFHGASGGRSRGASSSPAETPFVHNGAPYIIARGTGLPYAGHVRPADAVPPCVDATSGPRSRLRVAPKPFGLPRSTIGNRQPVIACIRVARLGYVEDAILSFGTGDAALDAQVLDLIRARWLFDPLLESETATYVLVRINPDRPDEPEDS